MAHLNAYFTFNGNCREAMTFYKECLGGELELQTIADSPMGDKFPAELKECILNARLRSEGIIIMGRIGFTWEYLVSFLYRFLYVIIYIQFSFPFFAFLSLESLLLHHLYFSFVCLNCYFSFFFIILSSIFVFQKAFYFFSFLLFSLAFHYLISVFIWSFFLARVSICCFLHLWVSSLIATRFYILGLISFDFFKFLWFIIYFCFTCFFFTCTCNFCFKYTAITLFMLFKYVWFAICHCYSSIAATPFHDYIVKQQTFHDFTFLNNKHKHSWLFFIFSTLLLDYLTTISWSVVFLVYACMCISHLQFFEFFFCL